MRVTRIWQALAGLSLILLLSPSQQAVAQEVPRLELIAGNYTSLTDKFGSASSPYSTLGSPHPQVIWLGDAGANNFDLAQVAKPALAVAGANTDENRLVPTVSVPATGRDVTGTAQDLIEGPPDQEEFTPVAPPIVVERSRIRTIRRLEMAYHVANAADVITTLVCLESRNCHEANPLWGRDPNPLLLVGTKAAYSAAYHFGMRELSQQDEGAAEVLGWVLAVAQSAVVGFNIREQW